MQELVFVRKGLLEWRDVAAPELRSAHAALVRPIVAARCDGDCVFLLHDFSRALGLGRALHLVDPEVREFGTPPFGGPFAYGHECVAEVVAVGDDVKRVSPGERVVVPWSISCGACAPCRRGLSSHCARNSSGHAAYGFGAPIGGHGGAVSDLLHVPHADAMLVALPEGVSPLAAASAADNLSDAWRTVAPHLSAEPGAPVLVVGGAATSIGLYAAGIAVALGASRVDYLDSDARRLELAAAYGANPLHVARDARFLRRGQAIARERYPITVEASSRASGLELAIRSLAPGGVCTAVGYYFRRATPLPLFHMYLKGTRVHIGVSNARAHLPEVLELLAAGRFEPARIAPLVATWDEAPRALLERDVTKVFLVRAS